MLHIWLLFTSNLFCFYLFISDPFQLPVEIIQKSDDVSSCLLVPWVTYSNLTMFITHACLLFIYF